MPESAPTPPETRIRSNRYLAWRIGRYLAIQGVKGLFRGTWRLLGLTVRVFIGLGRLLAAPPPSYVNRARLGWYGWIFRRW